MTLRNAGSELVRICARMGAACHEGLARLQGCPCEALDIDLSTLPAALADEPAERSADAPAWRTQPAVRFRP